ncbi:hypothetical protein TNIN_439951 [Trichonephila inaurata madagascariensis]|uniref:Uncharacterized protein n=1 Tax=Trichonephila inaurata madagascariensis TaxID=2747483 RepID=A0A8X6IB96_9ARAC|nr:hypothetical protein TNIN_439951 [Trichonephila inaurata madagascariensis]
MYFSRNFLETICDHSIVGCDNLETVVERYEDLPELVYENVLYYWMENCHKKWKSILDGPSYLSMMRQPDDYDPEETWNHRNDPMCHSIRCRGINFHCWTVQTHMSKLLFTHLLNAVKEDFEEDIDLYEKCPSVWFRFYYKKINNVTFHVCSDCSDADLIGDDCELCEACEEPNKHRFIQIVLSYELLPQCITKPFSPPGKFSTRNEK